MQLPLTQPPELPSLFAGVFAVLLAATIVGRALHRFVAHGRAHAAIDNLNARINAWWAMIIVTAVAFAFSRVGVTVLFALVAFVALREFLSRSYTRRGDYGLLVVAFYIMLPAQFLLVACERYVPFATLIPIYALLILPVAAALSADRYRVLDRMASMQVALITCVYCISYVPALMSLRIPGYGDKGLLLVGWLLLVVQSSDVLQYLWGKALGRHRIAPSLSPSKTVEGFVGGIASATARGAALFSITPFTPWQACGVALGVTLAGFVGGLMMSAMKRARGIKDWGSMIGGHGGMLDRVDSLILAAPLYYDLLRYGWHR